MGNWDVKNTKEWQALNKIWKSCSAEQQSQLRGEFQLLTDRIRRTYHASADEYGYLRGISQEAKDFVISEVKRGHKNIYHSVMAIIQNRPGLDQQELMEFYLSKYGEKRPYLVENKALVEEVVNLCWKRQHERWGEM